MIWLTIPGAALILIGGLLDIANRPIGPVIAVAGVAMFWTGYLLRLLP